MKSQYRTAVFAALIVTAVGVLALAGIYNPEVAGTLLFAEAAAVSASDLKKLEGAMQDAFKAMGENIKRFQDVAEGAREEVRKEGTLHAETNKQLTALGENFGKLDKNVQEMANKWADARERLQDVEQRLAKRPAGGSELKSAGQMVIESDQYKAAVAPGAEPKMGAVKVGSFFNAPVYTESQATTSSTGALVQPDRQPGIIMPALRRLTIRDLLPVGRTGSNLIEFCTENVFTNSAGIQGADSSPSGQFDGQPKAESGITFTLNNAPVRTIATWIPASRQIMADAAMLSSYINQRLTYAVKLDEEDELLNGSGSEGHINGLVTQAADYTRGASQDTILDTVLKAFLQVSLAEYEASAIILNPIDWTGMQLLKDSQGRYLFSDPQSQAMPTVWGRSVVATQSMAAGNFLAGAFSLCAQIWDREDATVRVSESHDNFFVRNMVAVLAEERIALTVYRPSSLVQGGLVHEA